MGRKKQKKNQSTGQIIVAAIIIICIIILGYTSSDSDVQNSVNESNLNQNIENEYSEEVSNQETVVNLSEIPEYSGSPYVEINNNIPYFTEDDYTEEVFEKYSDLDELGRCGVAFANICKETMPPEGDERGSISSVKLTGWEQAKHNGQYLYNRCHLIGYQLSDEDANELNLITGTRYFNVDGMLPFENEVAEYIDDNENGHVLYRITPIFENDNLLASGVEMEAWSVEDNGKGVCFNVYCYNVQPGVVIDYSTGESHTE